MWICVLNHAGCKDDIDDLVVTPLQGSWMIKWPNKKSEQQCYITTNNNMHVWTNGFVLDRRIHVSYMLKSMFFIIGGVVA